MKRSNKAVLISDEPDAVIRSHLSNEKGRLSTAVESKQRGSYQMTFRASWACRAVPTRASTVPAPGVGVPSGLK
jgi:hypothetical protein